MNDEQKIQNCELFDFPTLIKSARESLGETQAVFAKRFNSHGNTVSRWESGDYQAPYEVISFTLRTKYERITCPRCNGQGWL